MERWRGRVALVTGAGAGIGAAVATALLRGGMTVVGVARRPQKVQALATGEHPGKLHALYADVSKAESITSVFEWIKENLGCVHVLVNNAGIYSDSSLTEVKTEQLQTILNLNLLGLSVCTREAINLMIQQGVHDGHIIHIGSALAQNLPATSEGAFSVATKQGVRYLAEGLRKDLAQRNSKTKVTVVSPGLVDTDVFDDLKTLTRDKLMQMPHLQPSDVADAVLFALGTPPHVQVKELVLDAVGQADPSEW